MSQWLTYCRYDATQTFKQPANVINVETQYFDNFPQLFTRLIEVTLVILLNFLALKCDFIYSKDWWNFPYPGKKYDDLVGNMRRFHYYIVQEGRMLVFDQKYCVNIGVEETVYPWPNTELQANRTTSKTMWWLGLWSSSSWLTIWQQSMWYVMKNSPLPMLPMSALLFAGAFSWWRRNNYF